MPVYRWLLRLCPAPLRREYGTAMEEMFARRLADARPLGLWRRLYVWRRELLGVIAFALSERYRHRMRGRRKAGQMDGMTQEVRQAARRLVRTPAFTLAAVLTLALAIGANASIFAVVQHIALAPLPYPDADRLIALLHAAPRVNAPPGNSMPIGLYYQYADRARTLTSVAVYRGDERTITGNGEPERIPITQVTTSLASVLRVSPALGRWFTEAEGRPGSAQVAVLSHGLWIRRYGGDNTIIGRSITLSGVSTQIVGVMPASFTFPQPATELWIADQASRAAGLGLFAYSGVARLRDGATLAEARTELTSLIADLPQAYPGNGLAVALATTIRFTSMAVTMKEWTIGGVSRTLWILLASVGLVLLIACANVANLFLVRSEARQREVAVRRALGAGRLGIARYFLTESALLSMAGGIAGLALAMGAVRLLVAFGPATLPRLHEVRMDGVALAVTFGVSALTAVLFGVIPILHGTPLAATLHEHGRGNTVSRGRHRARRVLMGGQVALALVLLAASGLMLRSFQNLRTVNPGFDPNSALTFRVGLPAGEYPTRAAAVRAHHAIIDGLSALPGVTRVSAASGLPLASLGWGNSLRVEGRPDSEGTIPPLVEFRAVAGGFFEATGIKLRRGRGIARQDIDRSDEGVVVNQALVDAYFPGENPIGRRIASGAQNTPWLTIVGVVGNTVTTALAETRPRAKLYMPMSIAGGPDIQGPLTGPGILNMTYVVRTSTPPLGVLQPARRAIDEVDAQLAMSQITTLQDLVDSSSAQMAFTMTLLAIAAIVALVLGLVGIYGVMSYIVTQRTGEIGVRLALGETPAAVAAGIVRQGGAVTLAGIAIGLGFAVAGGRLIQSLLYGVSPRDPAVLAATTITLLAVALLACWLPARRAARLSPLDALRTP
jgi:putative ABC transport system permease protein